MAIPSLNNIQSSSTTSTVTTTFTLSAYTPTVGADDVLAVLVAIKDNNTTWAITGVTYFGTAMALVDQAVQDVSGTRLRSEMWRLDTPSGVSSSGDIVVTVDTSLTYDAAIIIAGTLLGAATGAPGAAEHATITGTTSPLSVVVTPADNDNIVLSVAAATINGSALTATSPHTEDLQVSSGNNLEASIGHTDVTTAAATTIEWSYSSGGRRSIVAASFGPAAAAVAIYPGTLMMGMG